MDQEGNNCFSQVSPSRYASIKRITRYPSYVVEIDSVTKATTLAEKAEARIQEMQRFLHYFTNGSVDDQQVGAH